MATKKLNQNQRKYVLGGILVTRLPFKDKLKHWQNGRKDARLDNVIVIDHGCAICPYINNEIAKLNSTLARLWQSTTVNAVPFINRLDYYQSKFDDILKEYLCLQIRRDNAIENARNSRHGSDAVSSQATVNMRVGKRVATTAGQYNSKIDSLKQQLIAIAKEVADLELESMYSSIYDQAIELQKDYINLTKQAIWLYLKAAKRINPKLDLCPISSSSANDVPVDYDDSGRIYYNGNHKDYCFVIDERLASEEFIQIAQAEKNALKKLQGIQVA